ncbi:MAG: transcriptional regulator [Candidatus Woesearchaeota archaeon]|nr:transcriptional regulator [Candidatus Woesearchaeota archaeon]
MKIPCELIVWHVLPPVRRELAKSMVNDLGLTQRAAAANLGITEAAVSQYIKSKRGQYMKFSPEITSEIRKAARQISQSKDEILVIEKICSLCHMIKSKGMLCRYHSAEDGKKKDCRFCMG